MKQNSRKFSGNLIISNTAIAVQDCFFAPNYYSLRNKMSRTHRIEIRVYSMYVNYGLYTNGTIVCHISLHNKSTKPFIPEALSFGLPFLIKM